MDIKKIKKLALDGALGRVDIGRAQVGSNGYGFVYFDFNDVLVDPVFKTGSGKVCGAGAHFGDFETFMTLEDVKFDRLLKPDDLLKNELHDMLLAGSLKTLLPNLEFGGDEILFNSRMFVATPEGFFFPATFYHGASGTSMGGWHSEDYEKFPKEYRNEFNFSPFNFDKDGLTSLIEAHALALKEVPVSDYCGILRHDLGNTLIFVLDGSPFIMELGYCPDENVLYFIKIILENHGYDHKQDKFKYKEMAKKWWEDLHKHLRYGFKPLDIEYL